MSVSLLLDTNVVIWTLSTDNKISTRARRAMSRAPVELSVSIVSVWEIVLKYQTGKLRFEAAFKEVADKILYESDWNILPMSPEHLSALAALPMMHKDPFDRMLVAQARHEGLTILTPDEQIRKYDVPTLW